MAETEELKSVKKAREDVAKTTEFLETLKTIGIEVPKTLIKSLNVLKKALDTGTDIADAAGETSDALKKYEKDLEKACRKMKDDETMACERETLRKWQRNRVRFVLSIEEKSSVVSKSIQKTVARYTPKLICERFAYCAKEAEKAGQNKTR